MCGIAGIVGFTDAQSAQASLEAMSLTMRHRGPDGDGLWLSQPHRLALAHRRLSIIDLSDRAAQPMSSHDGRFVVSYNGEIYNYLELRDECQRLGSRFSSDSDTEVIIEAYRHWGSAAFARFTGMWAFALCDLQERNLIICRDPFAIKPLYYAMHRGQLWFASEPKSLWKADSSLAEVDELTVELFEQQGYIEREDWTFFRNIKRFPHAHFAVIDLAAPQPTLQPQRYWQPPAPQKLNDVREAAAQLRQLLVNSVRIHLRSDVPVGACLSGGLDSSAVVCIGTRLLNGNGRFNTFTTRFPEHPRIDETKWAWRVINHTKANPRFAEPTFELFRDEFKRLLYVQDEPFGSASIFSQYAIFRRISQTEVKVVLDGQGADEQWAGYHGFFEEYLTSLFCAMRLGTYLQEGTSLQRRFSFDFPRHAGRMLKQFGQHLRARMSNGSLASSASISAIVDEREDRMRRLLRPRGGFDQTLCDLVCQTNLPQLLRYEDRNSMAHSIESRVPFLEVALVNFALSLPAEYKIRRGVTKALLRESLKGLVPDDVRLRVDKLGFPAPEAEWLGRAFDLPCTTVGGQPWRQLAVKLWREMLHE